MNTIILFGTESGNAELVAFDLADHLNQSAGVAVHDMSTFDVTELDRTALHIFVCSTYGEGDLPVGAEPFHQALDALAPDLTGLRYAIFGLGDSTYHETYSHGSEIIDALLTRLGAQRVSTYGRHDAASNSDATELALAWADSLTEELEAAPACPFMSQH
ncbi:hypothetical protein AU252_01560 [Pseudarthrobacter sulfonivorans]|uniref:Flavodoxin-like domain-containing protein n=1 Tax=Pseudarthrobacter sulfonivorans TaxID=121292 RepID=A0A0U3Q068_9MICC|nr:flavodoxin domain-containing protein [Pseudarthrobacter sulfonivorans]ALV40014.1 hypothetical protein AU252_01560 [Pseudarthrobacter sulfonivorans]